MKERTFVINYSDMIKKVYFIHEKHMKSKNDAIKRTIEDFKASHGLTLTKQMIENAVSGKVANEPDAATNYHMNSGFLKEFKKEAVAYACKIRPDDTLNSDVSRRLKTMIGMINDKTSTVIPRKDKAFVESENALKEMEIKLEDVNDSNFEETVKKISDKIRLKSAEQFAEDIINRPLEKNFEIAQWNDNKMTIRFIEMKFSINLPKTQKERIPVLEELKKKFI